MPITLNGDGSITGGTFNRPAFRVLLTSTQNINHNSVTTIQFNTEDFDTNNCFDTSNYRFTPNVAGYYYVFANATLSTSSRPNLEDGELFIRKNGTTIARSEIDPRDDGEMGAVSNQIAVLVQMNGSSDYLDVAAKVNKQSSSGEIEGGTTGLTYFQAFKLAI